MKSYHTLLVHLVPGPLTAMKAEASKMVNSLGPGAISQENPGYVHITHRCAQSPHTDDEAHLTTNGSSNADLSRRARAWSIWQALVLEIRIVGGKTSDRPPCWRTRMIDNNKRSRNLLSPLQQRLHC